MTSVQVVFVLISALVQLCTAEYVVYGWNLTIDSNLSLNPNQCHHPLITQLKQHYSHVISTADLCLDWLKDLWKFELSVVLSSDFVTVIK